MKLFFLSLLYSNHGKKILKGEKRKEKGKIRSDEYFQARCHKQEETTETCKRQ